MDRAVQEAYGWDDLAKAARCEFLLEYEEEEDDEPGAKKSKKKKPWRLRWPDDFRDEVLARLLELNEQRAKEERLAGKATAEAKKEKTIAKNKRKRGRGTKGAHEADEQPLLWTPVQRYQALIDKKFESGLSGEELIEVARLEETLDEADGKFYAPLMEFLHDIQEDLKKKKRKK